MERLNWAVLGLIGIVTALGLGTSSGAGKTKSDEQPVSVAATSIAPSCDACRIAQAEAATKVSATSIKTDDACPGNCAATGVCCDKSMSTKSGVVSITRTGEVYDVIIPADKKPDSNIWIDVPSGVALKRPSGPIQDLDKPVCESDCPLCKKKDDVPNLDQAIAPRSGLVEQYNPTTGTTDCPLTKAADAITNLTKFYVCEGGECLTKPNHGTLTITAVEPASTQPEGLSNLLAAAEAVEASKPVPASSGSTGSTIILNSEDLTKAATGTLTLSVQATDAKPAVAIVTETKAADAKPAIDNSRAAARAAKLAKLEAKLEAPWELEVEKITLEKLASAVQQQYGVPVIIDRKSLEEAAFDLQTPINVVKQPEIEAGEYLKGALNDLALTWIIPASSDRVLITTQTAMEGKPLTKVYDIADLMVDENDGQEPLIQSIQNLISPTTWKNNGGQGDLTVWKIEGGVKLVVSNNYWVQRELADFLTDLRSGTASKPNAVKKTAEHKASYWKRYTLLEVKEAKDAQQRQNLLAARREFLLAICRNIEGFDPENFEVANYDGDMLVTKQTTAVHRQIDKQLGLVAPSVGAYQSQSPTFPD